MNTGKLVFGAGLLLGLGSGAQAAARTETAVLAGGCFWGMEAVFEHVKGVTNVVSGFAGGAPGDANYGAVSSEKTGHAEAVRITYDPAQVTYPQLLQIFFAVAHDPTQLNRQGPDVGTSYRSAVFPQNAAQAQAAKAFIARLQRGAAGRVVTRIESGRFFTAEAEHQDFARKHPFHPYIVVNDRPKVAALKARYPKFFKG